MNWLLQSPVLGRDKKEYLGGAQDLLQRLRKEAFDQQSGLLRL